MTVHSRARPALAFVSSCALLVAASQGLAQTQIGERAPEDELIYFLLPDRFENGDPSNDRGGLQGDRLATGFDPTHKGFYHGGDLKGLASRLDYIQALGATAIWLGPIYKNKPVQGPPGRESAGYHGYWITDFTTVDPHFGTKEELRELIDSAHARGMKVYLDIITNHTADVIRYRECPGYACPYRSLAEYPYSTAGGVRGERINRGFLGERIAGPENFARLSNADFAYRPYVPRAEANVKVPAWLNDPIWYHNRGDSEFKGESLTLGDFSGLDDLMTEHPRVVQGFIDIYGAWIDELGVDGFRIDTAKHVNPEFWQAFAPAMLKRAEAKGISHFHIFGEVWTDELDMALLARATRVDRLPSVLDFAFRAAVLQTVAGSSGTDTFVRLFNADALYEGGERTARTLPTFISNHDNGRFAYHVRKNLPGASDDEVLKRVVLGHALMFALRGVPVVYAGDEQGFVGDGGDQDAREDMFASQVASYNDNRLLGTTATTAQSNFDRDHVIFKSISELAALRRTHAALRRGGQVVRHYGDEPGLLVVSRVDEAAGEEIIVGFNTSNAPVDALVAIDYDDTAFAALHGECAPKPEAPGSYRVTLAPLAFAVCRVEKR